MKRFRFIAYLLFLVFVCACGNNITDTSNQTTVNVTDIDFSNLKQQEYTKKLSKENKINDKYNVDNRNFEYVKENQKKCSLSNYVGKNKSDVSYYQEEVVSKDKIKLNIYKLDKNDCQFLHSFDNLYAISLKSEIYENNIYFNFIYDDSNEKKSGLWELSGKKAKQLSYFKTMYSDFTVDKKTGNLYTIEYHEKETLFREYDKNGEMINEKKFDDKLSYSKLYIKDENIYFIKEIVIDEAQELYDFQIDEYSVDNVFDNIGKDTLNSLYIKNNANTFATISISEDMKYITFNSGMSTVACDTGYNKCFRYKSAHVMDNDYFLVSSDPSVDLTDDSLYLTKFGSQDMEKILTFNDSFKAFVDGMNLNLVVYNKTNANDYKVIKYELK